MLYGTTFNQAVDDYIAFLEEQFQAEAFQKKASKRELIVEYLSFSFVTILSLTMSLTTAFVIYHLLI